MSGNANLTVAIRATVNSLADQIAVGGGNDLEALEAHAEHVRTVFAAAREMAALGWFVTLESPEADWDLVRFDHPAATFEEGRERVRAAYPVLDGVFDACNVDVLFGDQADEPSVRENLGSLAEVIE